MLSASKSGSGLATGYNLTRSLRLRSSASAYLSRTPSVAATSNKIFTISFWAKPSLLVPLSYIWFLDCSGQDFGFYYNASYTAAIQQNAGANYITTSQVFRDPAAWYHFVLAVDTTQATAANRIKLYVNGSQVTAFSGAAYPPQNTTFLWNQNGQIQYIGRNSANASILYDGYLAEFYSIDGQALTPSSFGSTNALTGVWQPARYTGTYGTNGFYLPFTDNSALTTSSNVGLGRDYSGNTNYWTTNNISITAGVTYDSMTDVPTLTSATAANFCTWNPIAQSTVVNGTVTRSNGNLTSTDGGTTYGLASIGTIASTTGKFYWEVTLSAAGDVYANIGVVDLNSPLGAGVHTGILYAQNGTKNSGSNVFGTGGGGAAYGASYTVGDVIGVALDLTAGTITFYKNNTSQGVAYTGISGNYTPAVGDGQNTTSYTFNLNCGQRPFAYTPPTGFVALNTYNLPTSTIVKGNTVMDATLYTGTGAALTITNAAPFKPDLVWIKVRSNAVSHALTDSVRGISSILSSDLTSAQATQSAGQGLTAFNSNGFSLGTQAAGASDTNFSGRTYVGWQWQAGQGTTSSNTSGSITSTVSVNASAGFSVVTFAASVALSPQTVGHGLGVSPSLIIVKPRSSAAGGWYTYHSAIGATQLLQLNLTSAQQTTSGPWNNTAPTSSVFTLGGSYFPDAGATTYVAYCWTPIAGFSAFGSLTGNGSADGVFVYLGFKPRFILYKRTDSTSDWRIWDTARSPYNAMSSVLYPNGSDAEFTASSQDFDALSNGFKIRNSAASMNASGGTYIYAAFASNPFRNSLAQ